MAKVGLRKDKSEKPPLRLAPVWTERSGGFLFVEGYSLVGVAAP
jgi:hypothetical protein